MLVEKGRSIYPKHFDPSGRRLLVHVGKHPTDAGAKRKWVVFSVSDLSKIAEWEISEGRPVGVMSRDGKSVATGKEDGVRLWSLNDINNPTFLRCKSRS